MKKRVFIFGDVHGINNSFLNMLESIKNKYKIEQNEPKKNNIIIIAGDCGFCFYGNSIYFPKAIRDAEIEKRKKLSKLPFTFVCVLGNHENYDYIYSLPDAQIFGAKAFKEKGIDNIFYLKNGEILRINNKKIWTFGGGLSIDKKYRLENVSWWKDEIRLQDFEKGKKKAINNKIDYIITHDVPREIFYRMLPELKLIGKECELQYYFDEIDALKRNEITNWFSGHYHPNKPLMYENGKYVVLPIMFCYELEI